MASGGRTDKMSDETFDFICTSCAAGGTTKEAVKYCVGCQGYCCQDCVDIHAMILVLKSHTLLDDLGTTTTQESGLPEVPTETCKHHKTKLLDMYCKHHNTVGCYVCFAEKHKSCEGPHSIPDIIDELYAESEYSQTSALLKEYITRMQSINEISILKIEDLNKSKENAISAIKALRKELETMLDKLDERYLQALEIEYEKIQSKLLKEQLEANNAVDVCKQLDDQMGEAAENRSQRFVCMKLAEANIAEIEQMKIEVQRSSAPLLDFEPHSYVTELLQQVERLGELSVSSKVREDVYKVRGHKVIYMRLYDERTGCNAWGSCVTDDDMLLVTDCANKRLKRFDIKKLANVDYCDVPNAPFGVCYVGQQEAAVACASNTVQLIKLNKSMTQSRKMNLKHKCFGIAYDNHKLYITDNDLHSSVYIYGLSGTQLQKVTNDKAGNQLFTLSRHITISQTTDSVAVGGWQQGWVCFDKALNHIASYSETDSPRLSDGICNDGRGNIFVAGFRSNNIVQFHEDGTKRGVIVTSSDKIKKPHALCFHQGTNRLFVTMESSDVVRVYDLK